MSKHHHKPHEGHSDGTHLSQPKRPLARHHWGFYVAGLCILVALVVYLLSGDLAFAPRTPVTPAAATH